MGYPAAIGSSQLRSPALPSAPMRRVRVAPHRARGQADISDGDDQLADRRPVAELGNRLAAVFEAEALGDARLDLALFPQLEQPRDISAVALGFTRRSEERRVGEEWVSTCRSRWSPA